MSTIRICSTLVFLLSSIALLSCEDTPVRVGSETWTKNFTPIVLFKARLDFDMGIPYGYDCQWDGWPWYNLPGICTADLDGDGDTDVILPSICTDEIVVLFNNGNGTFGNAEYYEVGSRPTSIAAGDLDGNGTIDLAVTNRESGDITILLNDCRGKFLVRRSYVSGGDPASIRLADLDGDGYDDVIAVNIRDGDISILFNRGSGVFFDAVRYGENWTAPSSMDVADLDGDGDTDIVLDAERIWILSNRGDGTFEIARTYDAVGKYVAAADLDADGDADIVDLSFSNDEVAVLLNHGDGTFADAMTYTTGDPNHYPISLALPDINGDGYRDIAAGNLNGYSMSILLNRGDGSFTDAEKCYTGFRPSSISAADFNGDGKDDLVFSDQERISVFLNYDGSVGNTFLPARRVSTAVVACDLDGDMDIDIAVASDGAIERPSYVSIMLNNGDGSFAGSSEHEVPQLPISIDAADLDGDGDNDLAVVSTYSGEVSIFMNDGVGTFSDAVSYAATMNGDITNSWSGCLSDIDGDGSFDLVVADFGSGSVSILLNQGDGTFRDPVQYGVGSFPGDVFSCDLNGDGHNDIATANWSPAGVSVLINNGDGTFQEARNYSPDAGSGSIYAADMDNDGDTDIIAEKGYDEILILFNDGGGLFTSEGRYIVGHQSFGVVACDLNGDGFNDVVTTNLITFLNRGDGRLARSLKYGLGGCSFPESVRPVDIDMDGDIDLVTANYDQSISILYNLSND